MPVNSPNARSSEPARPTRGFSAIRACRCCSSNDLVSVFDLGSQPFANSLLKRQNGEEQVYPLELGYCQSCGLAQLLHTADPKALFSHYVWVTGTSATARAHAERFCEEALARVPGLTGDHYVLEIASNDGTFLKPFMGRGIPVLGVDPAQNIAAHANAAGIPTRCGFFGVREAEAITEKHGRPRIVIARNVLPHVADPVDFVTGIAQMLGSDGWAIIEFHDSWDIQRKLQYDSIYHEHACYFTLTTIDRLLSAVGLQVVEIGASPISGGSIVAYVCGTGGAVSPDVSARLKAESAADANVLATWRSFGSRAARHATQFKAIMAAAQGQRVVGYGASARSSTLLNYAGIDHRHMVVIADQNPSKHGLFTAGTRIPIDEPARVFTRQPELVVLLAWNFRAEIMGILRSELGYAGKVIAPLPAELMIETM